MTASSRILLDRPPFLEVGPYRAESPWHPTAEWPGFWLRMPANFERPSLALFRCRFVLSEETPLRLHVTADERYELYLDGNLLGRGSERGDINHWYYETYEPRLAAGEHVLVARVWALGVAGLAPWAQLSVEPGFFCCPEDASLLGLVATGVASWESKIMPGCSFRDMAPLAKHAMGSGPSELIDGSAYPWGWERGIGSGWEIAEKGQPGFHGGEYFTTKATHWLRPAPLPSMQGEHWSQFSVVRCDVFPLVVFSNTELLQLLAGRAGFRIEANSRFECVIDLEDYVCAYPGLRWSGGKGAFVSLGWAEALLDPETREKVRRGDLAHALFEGPQDELSLDGRDGCSGAHWWRCGRFTKVTIITEDESLNLEEISLRETRYPFLMESSWEVPDPRLHKVFALCVRTWQACAHETYLDCPYYEQLMYVADARIQALLTYTLSPDARLPRKVLELFDSSRLNPTDLVVASHPSGGGQLIPPFALWWIAMVSDYAQWRGDREFIRSLLPGVRATIEQFLTYVEPSGLLRSPAGWNFLDWAFEGGVPPGGVPGEYSAAFQAQWLIALRQAADLENYAGDAAMAGRWARLEDQGAIIWQERFWNEGRGLFADDPGHGAYSEHSQCLALLTGKLTPERSARILDSLAQSKDLVPVSGYFTHYLFEAGFQSGSSSFFGRLAPWFTCVEEGFQTFPETFGRTRSDCHAWNAHPLFHYLTGVLGIRPGTMGFGSVEIRPSLGDLPSASGTCVHPCGPIRVALQKQATTLWASIELPVGLSGILGFGEREIPLVEGLQEFSLSL